MELMIEGVLSIQAGENARIIKEKIRAILEMKEDKAEKTETELQNSPSATK